jgi:hypothetical protein
MIRLFKILRVALLPLVFALIVGCGGSSTSASAGKKDGSAPETLTPKNPAKDL